MIVESNNKSGFLNIFNTLREATGQDKLNKSDLEEDSVATLIDDKGNIKNYVMFKEKVGK